MKTVILHGHLRKFGTKFKLDVKTPAEAVRALCVLCKGFRQHVEKHSESGYRILVGKQERDIGELHFKTSQDVIRIVPIVTGASAVGRIIVGAAIIAVAWQLAPVVSTYSSAGVLEGTSAAWGMAAAGSITYGGIATFGAALVLGGVAEMLFAQKVSTGTTESADNKPSYTFSGAVNTIGQGNPISILYGRLEVGSQVISSGISTEQIAI